VVLTESLGRVEYARKARPVSSRTGRVVSR
jgi:hypothetical protein